MAAPTSPQHPDPNTPVDQIIFLNFMKMIHRGQIEVEEANRQLDLLGFDPTSRFWGCNIQHHNGRSYVHYIKWQDGAWANGTHDHQDTIRKIRTGQP